MRTVVSVMIALPTASLVLAVLAYSPATAEEQTLKGRLVVTQATPAPTALPSIDGHTFVANKYMGVAVFEDGQGSDREAHNHGSRKHQR